MTYEECINLLIKLQKEARKKIINELNKYYDMSHCLGRKWRTGLGVKTKKNDRRLFMWIPLKYNNKEYSINLFYNEIDFNSGNPHSQMGRIIFVKDYIHNGRSHLSSPNELIEKDIKQNYVTLKFNEYKWINPLDCIENFTQEECKNKKWLTIDDVLENPQVCTLIADGFKKFIDEDTVSFCYSKDKKEEKQK